MAEITERFEYDDVKRVMNVEANDTKAAAKKTLDEGTEALKEAVGKINPESPGMALAGQAATNIAAKWNNLAAEFDAFVREIDKRIENANTVSNMNKGLEQTTQQTVGGGQ